ncbi:hypothetical protein SAMN05421690_100416 [Nitrosomonas sp. Nm51]|uniref:DUF6279 family lipoprotein n=1 Tax=Nitrosomonas sp. Nm51 TaxID=133720 RepID=UPI0008C62A1F|nr:DUF6279 family lipoprotein [Nitrosomonas sp. Nm51]SEQ94351.1 hypothetical protein SAMN05421690_100416 [Nitrosomonas sp. Nm51]
MQKKFVFLMLAILLLLSSGCSIVRFGYDRGPYLAWWWLDGYVDFDRDQKPLAKQAIHDWFDWHRSAQLPAYAAWLSGVRSRLDNPLTAEQVCRWSEDLQNIIAPAFDYAAQLGTPVVLSLGEAQWQYLEQRYAKSNDKLRSKYLQPDPDDRLNAAVKRTVRRIENLYGTIDEEQRVLIVSSIEASPFDPEAWLLERQRRQRVTISVLQRIATESIPAADVVTELRQLIEHMHRSDDADYRTYQRKLSEYTCGFIARLHNSATSTQRLHVHDKLNKWENDLRILINHNRRAAKRMQIAKG